MKCQNCGENDANVNFTQIINGIKTQMSLCDRCAKELGIEDIDFDMPIGFSNFLGDMFDFYDDDIKLLTIPRTINSNKTKNIIRNIKNTDKNTKTKKEYIKDEAKNIDKRISEKFFKNDEIKQEDSKNDDKKSELEKLEAKLEKEIKEERYEDAAITRDEIKKLKN